MQDHYRSELHGTAVIGRIAGKSTGVAQESEIIVVRGTDGRGAFSRETCVDGMVKIYDEIMQDPGQKSIINISWGFIPAKEEKWWDADDDDLNKFEDAFQEMTGDIFEAFDALENGIVVMASGNLAPGMLVGDESPVDLYPQLFAKDGKVGKRTISAPGKYVNIAARYENGEPVNEPRKGYPYSTPLQKALGLKLDDGTSFAAPTVTGALAAWLSVGVPLESAIQYMYDRAHPRVRGGPPALYNGISVSQWPAALRPSWASASDGRPSPTPPRALSRFDRARAMDQPIPTFVTRTITRPGEHYFVTVELQVPVATISVNQRPLKTKYTDYFAKPTPSQ
ncbi:hypothetical protein H072_7415 [Dactylellina haptotyla CBS 200.50]|uniref:Peptidase S8/S53 domain-containing protein n=1 Tax=Dactylellina haptotyla (strain CBS 200.50) TaxID=1284197 RepID=S8ACP5_DACHA|nr:hypothetical protein H072_7415 [Dactylellina haptotyla CBS 200.50]